MADWKFVDPSTAAEYVFDVNPREASTAHRKNVAQQATVAADGALILQEGRDQPQVYEVSGLLLEQAQLTAFESWFDKRYVVEVTDDNAQTFDIYLVELETERVIIPDHPWAAEWTLRYLVV